MHYRRAILLWIPPLTLYSVDALAWGLYTHVYFAQLLIWAIPLADPRFRGAVRRFPDLLLAGACLPDTALFNRIAGVPALRATHQWSVARRMLDEGREDETRALAVGYASHLLADVIAHNCFVPEHERLWFDYPVLTHAASEWAMDEHVAPQLFAFPGDLLSRHRACLARHAARFLGCTEAAAAGALLWLGGGERLLRGIALPAAVNRGARWRDATMARRFDRYASETGRRLRQLNRVIAGEFPAWQPEPDRDPSVRQDAAQSQARGLRQGPPLPQDLFHVAPGLPR